MGGDEGDPRPQNPPISASAGSVLASTFKTRANRSKEFDQEQELFLTSTHDARRLRAAAAALPAAPRPRPRPAALPAAAGRGRGRASPHGGQSAGQAMPDPGSEVPSLGSQAIRQDVANSAAQRKGSKKVQDTEMSFLSDGDSTSSDSCSKDRDASQQRRELVEGQSSRTGALSTNVEQMAYNLRPQKDDSVTIQRRSEFARLRREQQNQRRNKRKEAETLRQEDIRDYENFFRTRLWLMEKKLPEKSDKDLEDRIEVITDGTSAKMGVGGISNRPVKSKHENYVT